MFSSPTGIVTARVPADHHALDRWNTLNELNTLDQVRILDQRAERHDVQQKR